MPKVNKNTIYEIKVLKWEIHNPDRKKSYTHTLIANNLIHHTMLGTTPVTVRYMWIGLLLICGSMQRDTIEVSESRLRELLESSWSSERALDTLQSFQLLTYKKVVISPYINRIELNRIKENRIEGAEQVPLDPPPKVIVDKKPVEKKELHWLALKWNQHITTLPKVSSVGTAREKKIKTATDSRPDPDQWDQIFKNVEESDFLSGRDGKWTNCGFDWLLNETNATKVFEGNYKNKNSPTGKPQRSDGSQYRGIGE